MKMVEGKYELIDFSYIDDVGDLHEGVQDSINSETLNFGCHFGCAVLELKKK